MDLTNKADNLKTTESVTGEVCRPDGSKSLIEDLIIHEHFMEIIINGLTAFRLSCTAEHLPELVLGRLYTEGLIDGVHDVERIFICGKGNLAEVTLAREFNAKAYDGTEPTCCTGNVQLLQNGLEKDLKKLPEVTPAPAQIFELAEYFKNDSVLHKTTSGTHSCYISLPGKSSGREIAGFEDISRHNALDKAVGHMLLCEASPKDCILYTTGRVPLDMVQKVIRAGIPVLISKSVPTDAAFETAKEYGLALICKAWPDSYVI